MLIGWDGMTMYPSGSTETTSDRYVRQPDGHNTVKEQYTNFGLQVIDARTLQSVKEISLDGSWVYRDLYLDPSGRYRYALWDGQLFGWNSASLMQLFLGRQVLAKTPAVVVS